MMMMVMMMVMMMIMVMMTGDPPNYHSHVLCRMESFPLIQLPCPYDTWMHAFLSIPSILMTSGICCICLCHLMPWGSWVVHILIDPLSWSTDFLMSVLPELQGMLCSHGLWSSWWLPLLSESSSHVVLWSSVLSSLDLASPDAVCHALTRFAYVASHTSSSTVSDCLLAILLMQAHDPSLLLLAPCSWSHSNHTDVHLGRPGSSWLVWSHPPGWSLLIFLPFSCIPVILSSMYLHRCNDTCFLLPPWSQAMSNGYGHWWGWVLWMIFLMPWWVLFSTPLLGCHLMTPWPCDPWGRSSCWMMGLWRSMIDKSLVLTWYCHLINPHDSIMWVSDSSISFAGGADSISLSKSRNGLMIYPADSKISCLSNLVNALKFFQMMGFHDGLDGITCSADAKAVPDSVVIVQTRSLLMLLHNPELWNPRFIILLIFCLLLLLVFQHLLMFLLLIG